jgi:hypothetical protein
VPLQEGANLIFPPEEAKVNVESAANAASIFPRADKRRVLTL